MGRLLDEPGSKSSLKMKAEPQGHECIHEDLFTSINRRLDGVESEKKDTDDKLDEIKTAVNNVDKKVDIINAINNNNDSIFNKTTNVLMVLASIIGVLIGLGLKIRF
jgi:Mg2+ and Co2+ transporter CorA